MISLTQETLTWLLADGREEHWNLKCWRVLKGSDTEYLPASAHSFSNRPKTCTAPATPWIGKSRPHGPISSWLCCIQPCTWGAPLPALHPHDYSDSKAFSVVSQASFSPQPIQKHLASQNHKKWKLKVLLEVLKNGIYFRRSYQLSKYSWVTTVYD